MSRVRSIFLLTVLPAILWLWLFWHLHYEWAVNPQYNYGWSVPFLAALLAYLRWQSRPLARQPNTKKGLAGFSWLLLGALLPLRLIEEANPDWRLLSWCLALTVSAFTFVMLLRITGPAWARHFAFPICFTLVAVPWLVQFENVVVQNLTGGVAAAAVEIAGWLGVGAYRLGNVIQLRNGFVGVDEACSGIRTLQAAIMISLFVGEILRLSVGRRVVLVLSGCAWVFVCNVLRAATLVMVAANRGVDALSQWHDIVGSVVLVLGVIGLFAIGWMLSSRWPDSPPPIVDHGAERLRALPRFTFVGLAWILVVFASSEAWYRAHETQLIERPPWQARWTPEKVTVLPIADSTRSILRFDTAQTAAWQNPPGVRWWVFFARWEPGRAALQLVRSHSPEICLPAIGRTFKRELESVSVRNGPLELPFRVYQFEQEGRPLFVFVCIEEDKVPVRPSGIPEWSARGRLLAVWNGQRNLGQRLLEIAVTGLDTFSEAEQALRTTVSEIVTQRS